MPLIFRVEPEHAGLRLDVYLSEREDQNPQLKGLSRTRLQMLIREGHLQISGKSVAKSNYRLQGGEEITLELPEPEPLELQPEAIPLSILYEDKDLAVIDKPAGMVVHPSGRTVHGTLVNALLCHLKDLSGIGGKLRPGIVHRLDKGTSGALIIAKHDQAHTKLTDAFRTRRIHKTYLALVQGTFKHPQGIIDFPIARHRTQRHKMAAVLGRTAEEADRGGRRRKIKAAVTRYEVLKTWQEVTQLALFPETGRTHQIRVHLSQLGHPVLGDTTYGYSRQKNQAPPRRLMDGLGGLALHAWKIEFEHPMTGQTLQIEARIPERLQKIIDYFKQWD